MKDGLHGNSKKIVRFGDIVSVAYEGGGGGAG